VANLSASRREAGLHWKSAPHDGTINVARPLLLFPRSPELPSRFELKANSPMPPGQNLKTIQASPRRRLSAQLPPKRHQSRPLGLRPPTDRRHPCKNPRRTGDLSFHARPHRLFRCCTPRQSRLARLTRRFIRSCIVQALTSSRIRSTSSLGLDVAGQHPVPPPASRGLTKAWADPAKFEPSPAWRSGQMGLSRTGHADKQDRSPR